MFLLKKILAPFFMPLSVVLLLALVGLFCLWFTRRQKAGKVFVTAAFGLLGLLGYEQMSDLLARPLEAQYPPLTQMEVNQGVKWIVVLGGGSEVDAALPSSTYLSEASLFRLLEGISLHNRIPDSKLILSGASGFEGVAPVAELMAEMAREMGVREKNIIVEAESRDTEGHAVFIKQIVRADRFIVVTSAMHIPRAVAVFRKQGMNPIPGPADYLVKEREGGWRPDIFFPSAKALEKAESAVHEYLGLVWARVRGQSTDYPDETERKEVSSGRRGLMQMNWDIADG